MPKTCAGPGCDKRIEPSTTRPSSYCSRACQQRAYRVRRELGQLAEKIVVHGVSFIRTVENQPTDESLLFHFEPTEIAHVCAPLVRSP